MDRTLFLASSSSYRAQILDRLRISYTKVNPRYIEKSIPKEAATAVALRFAEGKALSVEIDAQYYVIIGSDQVAHLDQQIFGKPSTHANALAQLRVFSGQWVSFTTGVCLLTEQGDRRIASETYEIRFRELSDFQISRYLQLEEPFDCAGSIKVESLGVTLLDDARGRDVNCLYGLPIMLLREQLESLGLDLNDFIDIG